jgi:hypothetical protein
LAFDIINPKGDRKMNKTILAIISAAAFVNMGYAEVSPETKVLAGQLLECMDMKKQMEQSFEIVKQSIPSMMSQMGVSGSASTEDAQNIMTEVMNLVAEEMNWDKLKEDYIAIYAETFTADELQGLVDFYNSPAGKKFTEKQPEIMQRSMQVSQTHMVKLMPKIQALATQSK